MSARLGYDESEIILQFPHGGTGQVRRFPGVQESRAGGQDWGVERKENAQRRVRKE